MLLKFSKYYGSSLRFILSCDKASDEDLEIIEKLKEIIKDTAKSPIYSSEFKGVVYYYLNFKCDKDPKPDKGNYNNVSFKLKKLADGKYKLFLTSCEDELFTEEEEGETIEF